MKSKTNAVRVSETQLPELFRVVQSCCEQLGMPRPDVYVMQQNICFVKYRTLYATHPHHLARLDHLSGAAAELGIVR